MSWWIELLFWCNYYLMSKIILNDLINMQKYFKQNMIDMNDENVWTWLCENI
jgi:hypothetical protein